jgi:hypothetical protein
MIVIAHIQFDPRLLPCFPTYQSAVIAKPSCAKGSMEEGGEGKEGDADLHGVWCCVLAVYRMVIADVQMLDC